MRFPTCKRGHCPRAEAQGLLGPTAPGFGSVLSTQAPEPRQRVGLCHSSETRFDKTSELFGTEAFVHVPPRSSARAFQNVLDHAEHCLKHIGVDESLLMEVERKVESRHDLAKQCGKANLLLGCEVSRSARTADEERREDYVLRKGKHEGGIPLHDGLVTRCAYGVGILSNLSREVEE